MGTNVLNSQVFDEHERLSRAFKIGPNRTDREFQFTERDFQVIASLVKKETGISLGASKFDMVYSRLSRRLRKLNLKDVKSYIQYIKTDSGHEEIPYFINALTTNLTKFFRESHHFDHLSTTAMPEALRRFQTGQQSRIRLWSAACSSGEEAFSMAMAAMTTVSHPRSVNLKILATDIDTHMLQVGHGATYNVKDTAHLSVQYKDALKAFTKPLSMSEDRFRFTLETQNIISFKHLNLIHEWPMTGPFDVIFCRNILIYFDPDTKLKVLQRMVDLLCPGGYLYLGHSESPTGVAHHLNQLGLTIYKKVR